MPLIIVALIGGQLFIRNQLKANVNLYFNFGALIALGGALTSFILSANQLGATKSHYHFYLWGLGGILMLIIFIAINLFSKSPSLILKFFGSLPFGPPLWLTLASNSWTSVYQSSYQPTPFTLCVPTPSWRV